MSEEFGRTRYWDPRVDDILRRLGRLEDTMQEDHATVAGLAKDLPRMHAENTQRFDRIEASSRTTSVLVDETRSEVKEMKEHVEATDKALAKRAASRDRWIRWGISTVVAASIPSFIVNIPHVVHSVAQAIANIFK